MNGFTCGPLQFVLLTAAERMSSALPSEGRDRNLLSREILCSLRLALLSARMGGVWVCPLGGLSLEWMLPLPARSSTSVDWTTTEGLSVLATRRTACRKCDRLLVKSLLPDSPNVLRCIVLRSSAAIFHDSTTADASGLLRMLFTVSLPHQFARNFRSFQVSSWIFHSSAGSARNLKYELSQISRGLRIKTTIFRLCRALINFQFTEHPIRCGLDVPPIPPDSLCRFFSFHVPTVQFETRATDGVRSGGFPRPSRGTDWSGSVGPLCV